MTEEPIDAVSHYIARVTDLLRDAVVELEVWRQNARSPEERQALHRVTALLSNAAGELRLSGAVRDPSQHDLHLAASANPGPAAPFTHGSDPRS
jgi:hypothetical protein